MRGLVSVEVMLAVYISSYVQQLSVLYRAEEVALHQSEGKTERDALLSMPTSKQRHSVTLHPVLALNNTALAPWSLHFSLFFNNSTW
ncbi:hypothetical protein I79_006674 [Cricetulus griseus]|uniref:Uncharacterized protein n=1 Tax=Cricetulus griseus TaxID=10029 RepID=G3H8H4_CRIGR|nr:hypothetical protein I79_006674 [Cricetulus griseus]